MFVFQRRRDLRPDPGVELHRRRSHGRLPGRRSDDLVDERRRLASAAPPLFGRIAARALQPRGHGLQPGRARHATLRCCDVGRAGRFEPDRRGMRQRVELFTLRYEHSELSVSGEPRRLLQAQRWQQPDRGYGFRRDRCKSGYGRALGQFGPWSRRNGIDVRAASLPPGMIVTLAPGLSGAPHTYGLMDVSVEAPPNAPPGDYTFQVKATDLASNVTMNTTVPVTILACQPTRVCSVIGLQMCGPVSNGCGGSFDCSSCTTGACSNGICCPEGSFFNVAINSCQPNSCPAGTVYCPAFGDCETDQVCDGANTPICHRVLGKLVCQ